MSGIRTGLIRVTGFNRSIQSFEVDDESDVEDLPTTTSKGKNSMSKYGPVAMSSSCFVIETAAIYKLKSDDTWKKL